MIEKWRRSLFKLDKKNKHQFSYCFLLYDLRKTIHNSSVSFGYLRLKANLHVR